jgi:hypothetical protein
MDTGQVSRQQQMLEGKCDFGIDDRSSSFKLDLAFFTLPDRCPAMVRQGSRKLFELFLYLAHRCLAEFREPVCPTHDELCQACGLDPKSPNSRSTLSRLLSKLSGRYAVIDYERVRRRRPKIRLAAPPGNAEGAEPRHYIYLDETWDPASRRQLEPLGSRAFAAQYMHVIAKYESDLARLKHQRVPIGFSTRENLGRVWDFAAVRPRRAAGSD